MDEEKEISNEEAFDQVEGVKEMPTTSSKETTPTQSFEGVHIETEDNDEENSDESETELISADFKVVVDEKSQQQKEIENGIKKPMDGATLTIESVTILPPKTKKIVDGVEVELEPRVTQNKGVPYYPSKLKIRFSDNIVEYYPSISFWINDGKINNVVRIDRKGNSKVSQLARLTLQKMSNNIFELETQTINDRPTLVVTEKTKKEFETYSKGVSDKEILNFLVGKKVKISTSKGKYAGNDWFRNDIVEIL